MDSRSSSGNVSSGDMVSIYGKPMKERCNDSFCESLRVRSSAMHGSVGEHRLQIGSTNGTCDRRNWEWFEKWGGRMGSINASKLGAQVLFVNNWQVHDPKHPIVAGSCQCCHMGKNLEFLMRESQTGQGMGKPCLTCTAANTTSKG